MIWYYTENEKLWMMQHNVFQNHLCSSQWFRGGIGVGSLLRSYNAVWII